ncbi:hypothetical protein NPIL_544191 [Nephila pilipes]|uniref:Uncharacterized protein n=1 Tax=Nephila pilipes TaxID=299642 RepID=A0A8X6PJE5_NEPPI|nr:hypothetical protein NPIL_544191 [Nephila pilipes]
MDGNLARIQKGKPYLSTSLPSTSAENSLQKEHNTQSLDKFMRSVISSVISEGKEPIKREIFLLSLPSTPSMYLPYFVFHSKFIVEFFDKKRRTSR